MKKYQWGIVGLGTIAHEFAESFNQETSELTAVASRTSEKAEKFAHRYNIPKAYGSYQEMLDDAEIDIIYIAVPNKQHIDHILAALEAGVDEQSVTILRNKENELAAVSLTFQAKMPKVGIVAFENGYVTIADYPRADRAEILFTDGTKEFIESGRTSEAMNYEINNMVHMIEDDLPNRSLFLTKDVIDILDQMQVLWKNM